MSQLSKVLADHRHGRAFISGLLSQNPQWPTEQRIVDDRLFLVGLDELFRTGIKPHERTSLLVAAREIAKSFGVHADQAPVTGYYAEDAELAEYARLMRGLQSVDATQRRTVANLRDYQRLIEVSASPIFGEAYYGGMLFPTARDPLTRALDSVGEWSVAEVTETAAKVAVESDDYSLIGMAAIARDPVALAALREGVIAYTAAVTMGVGSLPVYKWQVSPEVAQRASRFVATFNALFTEEIPEPTPENADYFGAAAYKQGNLVGRCVRIGQLQSGRAYHWAIYMTPDKRLAVQDFWHSELWTSDRYRQAMPPGGAGPANLV